MRCATVLVFAIAFGAPAGLARADVSGDVAADIAADIAALRAAVPACDAARAHCIGLQLHVTLAEAGGLIATADWIAAQLAAANRHFTPLDVGFQVVGIDTLPASAAHIATRRDRNNLATGRLHGTVIHVFIIAQLDDVDEIGQTRFGVAWHTPNSDRKYILLSTQARERVRVLAHELGHVFGLPHSKYAISIMNKTERAEPPMEQRTFADEEIAAMRLGLKRLLHDRVIADVHADSGVRGAAAP